MSLFWLLGSRGFVPGFSSFVYSAGASRFVLLSISMLAERCPLNPSPEASSACMSPTDKACVWSQRVTTAEAALDAIEHHASEACLISWYPACKLPFQYLRESVSMLPLECVQVSPLRCCLGVIWCVALFMPKCLQFLLPEYHLCDEELGSKYICLGR